MWKKMISVVIPSFKMGQFIGEALESVAAQTYRNWEVVVVDDAGPEDGTRATVEAFAAKHPDHRVEYIRHAANRGVSVARRTAFQASQGEFIAFLDADDVFLPEKIAEHVAVLEENPECVLVHGSVILCGTLPKGAADPEKWFRESHKHGLYDAQETGDYLAKNHICNSTVVCRSRNLTRQDFPEDMTFQYEDWLLWLILSLRGKFYFLDKPCIRYRCHAGAFSSNIYRSESAKALAYAELLLAFAPMAEAAGLGPRVGHHLMACLGSLTGKLNPVLEPEAAWGLVGNMMVRAALNQKWTVARHALGRVKRLVSNWKSKLS